MSAEAFRKTLNGIPQLKYWISGQTENKSSMLFQTRETSKSEIRNSIVDHIVPLEQLASMIGAGPANAIYDQVNILAEIENIEQRVVLGKDGEVVQKSIVFKEVRFDSINKIVPRILEGLAEVASLNAADVHGGIERYLADKTHPIDRGHVFGWSNTLVQRTKQDISKELIAGAAFSNTSKEDLDKQLKALDNFIDSLINVLVEYDIESSTVKGLDAEVYVKYKKTDKHWLTVWEAKAHNQKTGGSVGTAVGKSTNTGAKGFIGAVASNNKSLIEKSLANMVAGFISAGVSKAGSASLVEMESSPSLKKLFVDTIVSKLSGKRKKYNKEYSGNIKVGKAPLITVDNTKAKASIVKAKSELKKAKAKVQQVSQKNRQLRNLKGQFLSPASLQAIINANLTETIKRNMGDGSRRDILNLRTGRFAESVEVKKITTSREGMITAFYAYMKNPYATFSAGGRQQTPRSRDPKLLVSKSIREIVGNTMANKLRAVAL